MNDLKVHYPHNWHDLLGHQGHFAINSVLDDTARDLVKSEKWQKLDDYFKRLTAKNGQLFNLLSNFTKFEQIEFIISIRNAMNDWEEDGIWHDDGSRKLAFSLSLVDHPQNIEGGILEIRKRNTTNTFKILPFEYGRMIVFATGVDNFEHKINQVTKGKRIIIAGWCQ